MAPPSVGDRSRRHREVEVKLETTGPPTPPAAELARYGWRLDPAEVLELDALYYDTVDLRLARGGATLRRRGGGHDEGWHLKLPGDAAGERLEIHRPLGASGRGGNDADERVPPELAAIVFARTRGAALAPVVRIRTRREASRVRDDAGAALAEIDVDAVATYAPGDHEPTQQWNEVEVELIDGDAAVLRRLEGLMRAGGARRVAAPSKLARALELSPSEPLVPPSPKLRGRKTPASTVLRAWLVRQTADLIAADTAARLDTDDAIHKMRVALRRMRSALRTFRPLLKGRAGEKLRAELGWFAGELGVARDVEVLRGHLLAALDDVATEDVLGPVRARLTTRLAAEQARGLARAKAAMASERYGELLERLLAYVADPPIDAGVDAPVRTLGPRLVRRDLLRVRRRLAAADKVAMPEHYLALHEVRKAAKGVRYAGECLAPALGWRARRTARRFEAIQDDLGRIQDSRVARRLLREEGALAGSRRGENGFTYGVIFGNEAGAARDAEMAFRRHYRSALRRAERDWRN